jgi:hypothetical protein
MTDLSELPELCTTAQLAKILQATVNSLAQDRYLGRGIPYIKVGRRVRYRRQDVLDYLKRNSVVPEYPASNWAAAAADAGRQAAIVQSANRYRR